jgi:hypothetical protein
MSTTGSNPAKYATRTRARAATNPARTSPAKRGGLREALITQPEALLAALASAERAAADDVSKTQQPAQPRHTPVLLASEPAVALAPAPLRLAPPPLRDDERLGHSARPDVVVIIRRRRAA